MSFAETQLAKFGWKKGEGLGKNKTGITKSISVVKKNDTKGLGGKLDKWDFAWWDHVFNKSASNIKVTKDETSGEVAVEKEATFGVQKSKMGIISTSRPAGVTGQSPSSSGASTPTMVARDDYAVDEKEDKEEQEEKKPAAKSGPSWLFGFVKASASSQVAEDAKKTSQDFTTSAASFKANAGAAYDSMKEAEKDEYKDYSVKVTDEELFLACEGRTARKGARGEQPGKLGRVMQEMLIANGKDSKSERALSSTASSSTSSASSSDSESEDSTKKKTKKGKKDKKSKGKKDKKEKKSKKEKQVDGDDEVQIKKSKKNKKDSEDKPSKKRRASDDDEAEEALEPKSKKAKKEKKDKKTKKEKKSNKKKSSKD
ncbi:G patch domain-containing protein 4 [Actinomortierella ambigua]|uniref:G patch domain-containing protein 4 n=1 Tax=Actinomortierella ambigua TaxID=1343610 RepID=A0A9P6QGI6_9FUNG|nr:G patch domain-containing protein 4 [Actinomortierella ambigua]